jgi:hypothetical protein
MRGYNPRYFQPKNIKFETEKSLCIGLDLGQAQDFTALAIIDCVRSVNTWTGEDTITNLNCIHLQRWKLRTSYPEIVTDVVKLVNSIKSYQSPNGKPVLAMSKSLIRLMTSMGLGEKAHMMI